MVCEPNQALVLPGAFLKGAPLYLSAVCAVVVTT